MACESMAEAEKKADVVVACCRDCKKLPDAEDRLMAVTR
jgi:hypothetical protein